MTKKPTVIVGKKEVAVPAFKMKINVFVGEALLFLLTQILGLVAALKIGKNSPEITIQPIEISWIRFLIYFAIGTATILVFLRLSKKTGIFFEIIFALAIFSGSQIIFGLIMPDFWAMFCAALLVVVRFLRPSIISQNIAMVLTIAGIGSLLGLSLSVFSAIIILMVLSVYDFIAVYKTKHMIRMAKQMMQSRALLAFVVPQTLTGYKSHLKDVKVGTGQVFILGSGDVVMPLVAIAALSRFSAMHGLLVLLFSFLGLIFMQLIFNAQKIRRPMAALPPIALFTILGILTAMLVFRY